MRTVTVLGAGTMGAQIAAHAANAGFDVQVLDVSADAARDGMKRAAALRPDPFFTRAHAQAIRTGGFDTDLEAACRADWVVEAVVERLDIKQALFARVDAARAPGTIATSNTSGIPIGALADGRSEAFRRHFLGTHFFNPPRYLKLLELIPTPDTDPAVLARIADVGDRRLGKGVVIAKDTPNFIGNHIGLYAIARILEVWAEGRLTIEDVDAITGPALGRPKSATFRTIDITGLDVLVHVARNLEGRVGAEQARAFALPALALAVAERGWIGEKAGQGFYRREKRAGGQSEILTLDPATMTYRAQQKARFPAIERARTIEDVGARVRALFLGDDPVGDFLRRTLGPTLLYTASVAPDIAHSLDDVDRAMRWGYGWDLGPIELADAIGLRTLVDACPGVAVPPLVADRLAAGADTFRDGRRVPSPHGIVLLADAKARTPLVAGNPGASLVDLGDGVLAVELHSKMNALGGDAIAMLQKAVAVAEAQFAALVVSTDAVNFSAGANLMLLLIEAQEGNWDEIELMVRSFQRATMGLRLSKVPVVVAPAGLALGGGCEIMLHGDRVQAAAETYTGLVEAGVGLIPAGGGTKEMIARATGHLALGPGTDLAGPIRTVFETIGFAKVSTSAADARALGLLRPVDRVSMNRDRVVADAKALALARVADGYEAPAPRTAIPVGGAPVEAILKLGVHLARRAERLSDHDALIGRTLAHILAGGSLAGPALVSEQYLLDLEREAFLSLCAQPKTLARIKHTLDTGKPLKELMVPGMTIVGDGPPLVLVPGMQGRWEWMTPTVDALARFFRVATYSLCGEPGAPPLAASFDGDLARLDAVCRAVGPEPVVLVGVSFGGRLAVHYAAAHPERVRALVLASAPGPGFTLPARQARWVARPRLSLPVFILTAPGRARPELRNVFPAWTDRLRFSAGMLRHVLFAPMSSVRAAQRIRLALADDVAAPARRVQAPTLLVTGEDDLDQLVPPASTRQYRECIARTEVARLDGTGHMGVITRAPLFASLVGRFVQPDRRADAARSKEGHA